MSWCPDFEFRVTQANSEEPSSMQANLTNA